MNIKYNYYKFDPNNLEKENINRLAVEKIQSGSFVLDIGCATGNIGEYLIKEKKCKVFGIESRKNEGSIAKKKLNEVLFANIENKRTINKIYEIAGNKKFDVILATSVIEHLVNPVYVLKNLRKIIKGDGILIMTTPNIAHWTIRYSLLRGNFDYTEYGILDNTHLHFYTIKTFRELLETSGFEIIGLAIDSVGGGYPKLSRLLSRFFTNLFAYQILIIAKIKK